MEGNEIEGNERQENGNRIALTLSLKLAHSDLNMSLLSAQDPAGQDTVVMFLRL
jgi:hypothetical protein